MRLGWDDRTRNAPELARRAESSGVQMITVHGRTRCQFYKGEADWGAIRAVKDAISIPLVVNGDITSYETALSALEESGADAVMIGRGAQGQPWFPGQIGRRLEGGAMETAPALAQQLTYVRSLYDEICRHYGVRIGLRHARKHLGWALDVAAHAGRVPAEKLKAWRRKILAPCIRHWARPLTILHGVPLHDFGRRISQSHAVGERRHPQRTAKSRAADRPRRKDRRRQHGGRILFRNLHAVPAAPVVEGVGAVRQSA